MLVLTRKTGESILIGENAEIVITQIHGNRVKIAISAPQHVAICRGEISHRTLETQLAEELQNAICV